MAGSLRKPVKSGLDIESTAEGLATLSRYSLDAHWSTRCRRRFLPIPKNRAVGGSSNDAVSDELLSKTFDLRRRRTSLPCIGGSGGTLGPG